MKWFFLGPLFLYRFLLSPLLPPRCRFHPSCSQYSIDALQKYGAFKGLYLSLKRLGRCHPWGSFGFDPLD